jgi:hypothetical protein
MLNKEKQVVVSIEFVADKEGIHPLDVTFNQWRSVILEENPNLLDVYRSIGVEFGVLKKANFIRKEANLEKLEIQKKAKQNEADFKFLEKESYFWSKFETESKKIFKDKIIVKPYASKKQHVKDRMLNLVLSDIHPGSELDGLHNFLKYGAVEEARCMAKLVTETADYKTQYRDQTKLNVHILGDIIQNSLHDARDGADLAIQTNRSLYMLARGIGFLASQFPEIEVFGIPGNHDRWPGTAHRVVNHKDNSIANVIYGSLRLIFENTPNVKFNIPKTPFYIAKFFNRNCFFTHGDTVVNFGFPGSNIDVARARKQMNEFNGGREIKDRISMFVIGHVHTGSLVRLPNGILMTNGSVIPSDEYAFSVTIPVTARGQWLFESVPDHVCGDSRFLEITEAVDNDASLDKIISVYPY